MRKYAAPIQYTSRATYQTLCTLQSFLASGVVTSGDSPYSLLHASAGLRKRLRSLRSVLQRLQIIRPPTPKVGLLTGGFRPRLPLE